MQADSYLGILQQYTSEYKARGSKFYGFLFPANDAETFEEKIKVFKHQFSDATHVCSACVIGLKKEYQKCSDDGEPSNSSGRPILNILLSANITYVGCAVVRYYGGNKLGIPGLIDAYGGATEACILAAELKSLVVTETLTCTIHSLEAYRLYNFLAHKKEINYRKNEAGQFEIMCPKSMTALLRIELKKIRTLLIL